MAEAQSEVALADLNAVAASAARAHSVAQHVAQILQLAARHFVFARAVDLETTVALLEFQLAARHHAECVAGWGGARPVGRLIRCCRSGPRAACHRTFRNNRASHRTTLLSNDGPGKLAGGVARTIRTRKDRACRGKTRSMVLAQASRITGQPRRRLQFLTHSTSAVRGERSPSWVQYMSTAEKDAIGTLQSDSSSWRVPWNSGRLARPERHGGRSLQRG